MRDVFLHVQEHRCNWLVENEFECGLALLRFRSRCRPWIRAAVDSGDLLSIVYAAGDRAVFSMARCFVRQLCRAETIQLLGCHRGSSDPNGVNHEIVGQLQLVFLWIFGIKLPRHRFRRLSFKWHLVWLVASPQNPNEEQLQDKRENRKRKLWPTCFRPQAQQNRFLTFVVLRTILIVYGVDKHSCVDNEHNNVAREDQYMDCECFYANHPGKALVFYELSNRQSTYH